MCDCPSERWIDLSGATERLAVYYSKLRSSIDDYSGLNCDLTFLSVSLKSYHITMWMWLSYHEKFKVSKLPRSPIPTWQVSLWGWVRLKGCADTGMTLGRGSEEMAMDKAVRPRRNQHCPYRDPRRLAFWAVKLHISLLNSHPGWAFLISTCAG